MVRRPTNTVWAWQSCSTARIRRRAPAGSITIKASATATWSMGPSLRRPAQVFGPGVARQTTSLDGSQDWMFYASKTWSTYNRGAGTPGQQDNNEEYHRQVWTQPLNWRNVVCSGQTYAIPSFGTPVNPGTVMPLPSGDTGIVPGPRRIRSRDHGALRLCHGELHSKSATHQW